MALCEALALVTERIRFGTAIANLYTRHASDYAQHAAFIHELSGGRFHFGVGVSHAPLNRRIGVAAGKPLLDSRRFAESYQKTQAGELAPLVLAALRQKMVALAGELAQGVVFANVARSHVPASLAALPPAKRNDPTFFVGNMIPVCISEDRAAAAARNRRTLNMYLNFRTTGTTGARRATTTRWIASRRRWRPVSASAYTSSCRSVGWPTSRCSAAPPRCARASLAWREAGVGTPILVPSSAAGNQQKAFEELFAAFA